MRAGKLIRDARAMEAAGAVPCPTCGHRTDEHHELRDVLVVENGAPRYERHPDYKPLHFHCDHDDCQCVLVVAPR